MNLQESSNGVRITLHVKAHSKKVGISIDSDGTITLHILALPEGGKANQEIVRWFAKKFEKPTSQVRLIAGLHSRTKIIEVLDVNRAQAENVLGSSLDHYP